MKHETKVQNRLDVMSPYISRCHIGYDRHPDEAVEIAKRVERYAAQFAKHGRIWYSKRKADND